MEYLEAAQMVSARTRAYVAELSPLLQDLGEVLVDLMFVLGRLFLALSRPVVAFAFVLEQTLRPYLFSGLIVCWRRFSQQTPEMLAFEAGIAILLAILLALEHRYGVVRGVIASVRRMSSAISARYRRTKAVVRSQSRFAAAAMSQSLFFIPIAMSWWMFQPFMASLTQRWGLFLCGWLRPTWKTVVLLYRIRFGETQPDDGSDVTDDDALATPSDADEVGNMVSDQPENATEQVPLLQDRATSDRNAKMDTTGNERGDEPNPRTGNAARNEDPHPDSHPRAAAPPQQQSFATSVRENGESQALGSESRRRFSLTTRLRRPRATSGSATDARDTTQGSQRGYQTPTPQTDVPGSSLSPSLHTEATYLLSYWAVFSAAWGIRSLTHYFFPYMLSRLIQRLDSCLCIYALWLQIGLTSGANLVFPIIATALRQSKYVANSQERAEQAGVFLRMAIGLGILSADGASHIGDSLAEWVVSLFGAIFLITPRVGTFAGTVLIGISFPIYFTAGAAGHGATSIVQLNWLHYWAVVASMEVAYTVLDDAIGWLPLWYHIKLVALLWLQSPYYRGAVTLLTHGLDRFRSVPSTLQRRGLAIGKPKLD